jgi:hypothetical protein
MGVYNRFKIEGCFHNFYKHQVLHNIERDVHLIKKKIPLLVKFFFFGWVQTLQGENKIKRTRGTKVKFCFQGL